MSSFIIDKVNELAKLNDILFVDFVSVDQNTTFEDMDFHRVRGSIRLTSENVLLPSEIEQARQEVLHLDFA